MKSSDTSLGIAVVTVTNRSRLFKKHQCFFKYGLTQERFIIFIKRGFYDALSIVR